MRKVLATVRQEVGSIRIAAINYAVPGTVAVSYNTAQKLTRMLLPKFG